ncbi:MAG: restriction endonuclease subunit S domain-containing protein [Gemmatimonadaceae bacterium]
MKHELATRVPLGEIIAQLEPGVSLDGLDRPALPHERGVLRISAVSGGIYDPTANKVVREITSSRFGPSPRKGDLLISRANTAELVGSAALVTTTDPNLTLPDKLWRVHLRDPQRDSVRWLYHVINTPAMRKQLRARASGTGAGMKNLSQQAFLSLSVSRPSRQKQDDLAATLDSVADIELVLTRHIQLCHTRLRGLMEHLLAGHGQFPKFRKRPRRSFAIGELLESTTRPVSWSDGDVYPLLSVRRRSGGTFLRERRRGADIKGKALFRVEDGDFLISRMQVAHGALALVSPEHAGMNVSATYDVLRSRDPEVLDIRYFDFVSRLPTIARYDSHVTAFTSRR